MHERTTPVDLGPLVMKYRVTGGRGWWHIYERMSGDEIVRHQATLKRATAAAQDWLRKKGL